MNYTSLKWWFEKICNIADMRKGRLKTAKKQTLNIDRLDNSSGYRFVLASYHTAKIDVGAPPKVMHK